MSEQQWIPRTADRKPTRDDADKHGRIWVQFDDGIPYCALWNTDAAQNRCIAFQPLRTPDPYIPPEPPKPPVQLFPGKWRRRDGAAAWAVHRDPAMDQPWLVLLTTPYCVDYYGDDGKYLPNGNTHESDLIEPWEPAKVVTREDVDRVIHLTKHQSWDRTIDAICELFGVEA